MQSRFWDANEYWSSREGCPWTFFAYLREYATTDGMPTDSQACEMLSTLHSRGLRVGPWTNAPMEELAYFGCHKDDIQALSTALEELGLREFCTTRSQELLGITEEST